MQPHFHYYGPAISLILAEIYLASEGDRVRNHHSCTIRTSTMYVEKGI